MTMQKYMGEIQNHTILTLDDEQVANVEDLILHNLKLVVKIAHDYKYMGVELSDLIQEGNLGLIKAAETYNPSKAKFSTHAAFHIRKKMRKCLDKNCSLVSESSHHKNNINKIRRCIKKFEANYHRIPTVEYISEELKISQIQVRNALRYQFNGKSEINHQILQDYQHCELPSDKIETEDNKTHLKRLMQDLTKQERYILKERFFNNKTLKNISNDIGISKMQVKNIQDRAIKQLKLLM